MQIDHHASLNYSLWVENGITQLIVVTIITCTKVELATGKKTIKTAIESFYLDSAMS